LKNRKKRDTAQFVTATNAPPAALSIPPAAMSPSSETWTRAHDLALLLITVGYSSESDVTDEEFDSVVAAISRWRPGDNAEEIREIVFETVAVFQSSDVEEEVSRSIVSLKSALSPEQRERAMRDVISVAEADGVIQDSERSLITVLSELWEIADVDAELKGSTSVSVEDEPDWSLLHDITLLFIVLSHGSDGILSNEEIEAILHRLSFWQPDLDEAAMRKIMSTALQFYSTGPEREDIEESTVAVREHLSNSQRLAVVHDLHYIAEIDGPLSEYETDMIERLATLWGVDLRPEEGGGAS